MTESNGKLHCSICFVECVSLCKACHKPFCSTHVSTLDSTFCTTCVDFTNTRIEYKPLIDEEGVKHQGKHIILSGETWMRNRDIISKMTEVELEAKLVALKQAVHEAEMVLDFRRIALSQVESEKGDRYSRKLGRRKLIGAVDSAHKSATKVSGSQNESVELAKDAIKALKGLGLKQDAIANVLIKMTQKGKQP